MHGLKIASILYLLLLCLPANAQTYDDRPDTSGAPQSASKKTRDIASGYEDFKQKKDFIYRTTALRYQSGILYRDATKAELAIIGSAQNDIDIIRKQYKLPDGTGIFRMVPSSACGDPATYDPQRVVCEKHTMPGNGSSYSFREEKYRIRRLADILLENGEIKAGSVFTFGLLVKLDAVNLENINVASEGVKELIAYVPAAAQNEIKSEYDKFENGAVLGEKTFSMRKPVEGGAVFALRSIAYKGRYLQEFNGYTYNEFDYDKRTDIIVAFQILNKDADGAITVAWKLIKTQASPKLAGKK